MRVAMVMVFLHSDITSQVLVLLEIWLHLGWLASVLWEFACLHSLSLKFELLVHRVCPELPLMKNGVLVRLTIAAVKSRDQSSLGRKVFSPHLHVTVHHWQESGQELNRPGTWRQELVEGRCLVGCSLNLLSYRTKDHQSRDNTTHNGLGPSLSSN